MDYRVENLLQKALGDSLYRKTVRLVSSKRAKWEVVENGVQLVNNEGALLTLVTKKALLTALKKLKEEEDK